MTTIREYSKMNSIHLHSDCTQKRIQNNIIPSSQTKLELHIQDHNITQLFKKKIVLTSLKSSVHQKKRHIYSNNLASSVCLRKPVSKPEKSWFSFGSISARAVRIGKGRNVGRTVFPLLGHFFKFFFLAANC